VIDVVENDEDVGRHSGAPGHVELAGPGHETPAPPALVDNVETLANVVGIVAEGADWFRQLGTDRSPGTIVCTVTGDIAHPGVGEVALGTTIRQALHAIGGGASPGRPIKAVLGGVSAAPVPASLLDTPLTWEDMAGIGSGLGTGTLIVVGEATDMTAVAAGAARFLAVESCGQCTPCKVDGLAIADALERLCAGSGSTRDVDAVAKALTTVADGARCNLASQQQAVVGAILDGWSDELAARATGRAGPIEPYLVAEVTSLADDEVTVDEGRRAKQPDWSYDEWSGSFPADSR
jgi:NADH:ubiquinone oxidoreductase subunit F (NADH-binding)